MKKLLTLFLVFFILITLSACGTSSSVSDSGAQPGVSNWDEDTKK